MLGIEIGMKYVGLGYYCDTVILNPMIIVPKKYFEYRT